MRRATRKTWRRRAEDADPSREAVYSWEESWADWSRNTITLPACRQAIREACALYEVTPPTVRQHGDGLSWSIPKLGKISLQALARTPGNGGKNLATALHEAAHHIVYHTYGDRVQDHGPTFQKVYILLLIHFQVAPKHAITATARKFGLCVPALSE